MNLVSPSATGSLDVEFDCMCWLAAIHAEMMGSSVMHHVPQLHEFDGYLALDKSHEIWGNTASFGLQRTGYWEVNNLTILKRLRCVSSQASKETREFMQIFVIWHYVRKTLEIGTSISTTSVREWLHWNSIETLKGSTLPFSSCTSHTLLAIFS
jgi:hypothetical protein